MQKVAATGCRASLFTMGDMGHLIRFFEEIAKSLADRGPLIALVLDSSYDRDRNEAVLLLESLVRSHRFCTRSLSVRIDKLKSALGRSFLQIPTVSLGKKDVHVDVPTAALHKHDKEINMKTYSLGTHEKDVNVKVPGIETHRKEHGYGSTWDPKTPIPGTDADKVAATRHEGKKGGLFGLFGGGDDKSGAHHPTAEIDRKVAVPEPRGPEKKGGFLGFGGKGGARDGSGEKDFVGLKRYGDRQDIGVEFEEKKGQKVAGGLLLLAVGVGGYLAYKRELWPISLFAGAF